MALPIPSSLSPSSSYSSSSSSSSVPSSPSPTSSLPSLLSTLQETPTYTSHLNLITHLRQSGDLPLLRKHRLSFATAFPLSSYLWLEWLQDELRIAANQSDKIPILKTIFPKAVSDYLDVSLHKLRLELAIELVDGNAIGREVVESVIEDCQWMGVFYSAAGDAVWSIYNKFVDRVGGVGRPCVWEELGEGVREGVDIFENRLQKLEIGKEGRGSEERQMVWRSYVAFAREVSEGFAVGVWERFVAEFHAEGVVWKEYCRFAMTVGREGFGGWVAKRGVRNVPWEMGVWECRVMEVGNVGELKGVLEGVRNWVMNSVDYWGAEGVCKTAWSIWRGFGADKEGLEAVMGSLEFNLESSTNWGRSCCFAAGVLWEVGRREMAVQLMEEVVGIFGGGRKCWIEYARIVEKGWDFTKVADLYRRGIGKIQRVEDLEEMGDCWLAYLIRFGEKEGSAKTIKTVRTVLAERREKITVAKKFEGKGDEKMKRRKEKGKNQKGPSMQSRNRNLPKRKRTKLEDKEGAAENKNADGERAEGKIDAVMSGDGDEKGADVGGESQNGTPNKTKPKPEASANSKQANDDRAKKSIAPGETEPRTIFINNLAFNISESDLRTEFSFAGSITSIRIPQRSDGASKGIAYVEFADEEGVEKALNRNQTPIKGRVVWVRRSKPPARKAKAMRRMQSKGSARGRGRAGGLLQPRAVQRRVVLNEGGGEGGGDGDTDMKEGQKGDGDVEKPKSQADFRAMFLGK